jgi:DNA-binding transcriptional MerR regulator
MTSRAPAHGRFLAAEVGELAGVSGTTIGQWARRGLIRSSVSDGDPRVYGVEDVAEAAAVRALLEGGVRHGQIHRAIGALSALGPWPLSQAALAVTRNGRARIVLRDDDGGRDAVLTARGWQRLAAPVPVRDVRVRLARAPGR